MRLKKCMLLLPTSYNDGQMVPPEVLAGILRMIDEAFDGHTVDGHCEGAYKMANGSMAADRLLKVWVAVDPARVEEVRKLASRCAKLLKQESIWFEVTEAVVEFVRPPSETGEVS